MLAPDACHSVPVRDASSTVRVHVSVYNRSFEQARVAKAAGA